MSATLIAISVIAVAIMISALAVNGWLPIVTLEQEVSVVYASERPSVLAIYFKASREDFARIIKANPGDLGARDMLGESLLDTAISCGRTDLVPLLLQAYRGYAGPGTMYHAAKDVDAETVSLLLDYGFSATAPDEYGSPPLEGAVRSDRLENVRVLLRHGADVNSRGVGSRPVVFFAQSAEMIDLLHSHGARLNVFTDYGQNLAQYLREKQRLQAAQRVEELLKEKWMRDVAD